jgi:hypothetical protein
LAKYCKNNEYIKIATVTMEQSNEKQISIRTYILPTTNAKEIYNAMKYKLMPFYNKK